MTDIQKELYKLIKEIDEICTKNNIVYYLAGGSAIGALRHRGYIPWDDDMDIYMTRDNYLKFLEVCKTQLPPDRTVVCQELNRNFHNNFARYMDTSTTAIHINQLVHEKDPAGIIIDIFVLDPIPDDKKLQEQYIKDFMLYSDIINPSSVYSFRWRTNLLRYFKYRILMKKHGIDYVLTKLEKKMFCYKEEDCSKYILRWGGIPFIFDKDMYGNGVRYQYEDTMLLCPDRSADYLSWHYGDDWMFIPPHSGRERHTAIYSLDTPYTVIEKEAYKYYDINKTYRQFLRRKFLLFLGMYPWQISKDISKSYLGIKLTLKNNKTFKSLDEEINKALKDKNYNFIKNTFSTYIKDQNKRDLIGREDYLGINRFRFPIYLNIDEKYFDIAIEFLILNGQTSKALRFINVKEQKKTLSSKETGYKNYILNLQKAISLFAEKEYEKSEKIVNKLLNENFDSLNTIKLKIYLLKENDKNNENEILKYIDKGENLFSLIANESEKSSEITLKDPTLSCNVDYILHANKYFMQEILCEKKLYHNVILNDEKIDGEFLKFRADIIIKEDINKALLMYFKAYNNTENGIIHLQINDILNENIDYINNYINELYKNDNPLCMEYSKGLKEIIQNDNTLSLWAKCLSKFSTNVEDILEVIRELKLFIENKDSENTKTLKELKNIYSSLSNSNEFADIYCDISFNDTMNKVDELEEKIKNANIQQEWEMLLRSILLYKSGCHDASIKNSMKLFKLTQNDYIKTFLGLIFKLDIIIFLNQIINKKGKINTSDYKKLCNTCIDKWNSLYTNYEETIKMYEDSNILKINDFKKEDYLRGKNKFDYEFFEQISNQILTRKYISKIMKMTKFIYDLDFYYDI